MKDKQLSINDIGRKTTIAPSNLSRVIRSITAFTDDMAKRLVFAYPELADYIGSEDERVRLLNMPLKRRYANAITSEQGLFMKLLVPDMRKRFSTKAPDNFDFLPEFNLTSDLADRRPNEITLVLQVMETDLGPRLIPGDLVRAVQIERNEWKFAQGVVFIVYAGYAVIKRVAFNTLQDATDPHLILESNVSGKIKVPLEDIKQLMQVDKLLRGNISF